MMLIIFCFFTLPFILCETVNNELSEFLFGDDEYIDGELMEESEGRGLDKFPNMTRVTRMLDILLNSGMKYTQFFLHQ